MKSSSPTTGVPTVADLLAHGRRQKRELYLSLGKYGNIFRRTDEEEAESRLCRLRRLFWSAVGRSGVGGGGGGGGGTKRRGGDRRRGAPPRLVEKWREPPEGQREPCETEEMDMLRGKCEVKSLLPIDS